MKMVKGFIILTLVLSILAGPLVFFFVVWLFVLVVNVTYTEGIHGFTNGNGYEYWIKCLRII
jgi:hypothetical protein